MFQMALCPIAGVGQNEVGCNPHLVFKAPWVVGGVGRDTSGQSHERRQTTRMFTELPLWRFDRKGLREGF